MKLSELKTILPTLESLEFIQENGKSVPAHFHITELGQVDNKSIDCGGELHFTSKIRIQLWESVDYWHRLEPAKMLKIIEMAEKKLKIVDEEIEVEYQNQSIGLFGLDFKGGKFVLVNKNTSCLASEVCGVKEKVKLKLSDLGKKVNSCCSTESACC